MDLDTKLATMAGYADIAYLAEVVYDNDITSSVIIFINTKADAEVAIANAISETLIFSGIEAGSLDVMKSPRSANPALFSRTI